MNPNHQTQTPRNDEFDFFIGAWEVRQRVSMPDGSWREFPAETRVEPDLDGHILVEHWIGEALLPWEGMTEPETRKAIRVRAFDPVKMEWNIDWIDNRNRHFIPTATGNFAKGRGEFLTADGNARIVFSDIAADSLHWQFDVKMNGTWSPHWIMEMRKQS